MELEYQDKQTGELLSPEMAKKRFFEIAKDGTKWFSDYFDEIRRPMIFKCQFVGGERNRQMISLEQAEVMTKRRSADYRVKRAAGVLCHRAELDNRPEFDGYLGPMWDGVRYEVDGQLRSDWELTEFQKIGRTPIGILRYETQEVYDMMSN